MIHGDLINRWYSLTLAEQLGNTASEIGRSFNYKKTGSTEKFEASVPRALELLDLTISNPNLNLPRKKELLRAREQFCLACFYDLGGDKNYESLERYFMNFAFLARKSK